MAGHQRTVGIPAGGGRAGTPAGGGQAGIPVGAILRMGINPYAMGRKDTEGEGAPTRRQGRRINIPNLTLSLRRGAVACGLCFCFGLGVAICGLELGGTVSNKRGLA
jgi:hypothetical protein